MSAATTLPVLLEQYAGSRGDHPALRFLQRGEAVTEAASYVELHAAVAPLAGGLVRAGLRGVPVVLALPPGLGFVIALLACLRAGAIAVPVPFPPIGEARLRQQRVIDDLGEGALLAAPDAEIETGRLRRLDPATLQAPLTTSPPPPEAAAVIQYSSGSTRAPAGIVISHANLMANQRMISETFGSGPEVVGVNWLPPHHDMGLFGTILHPLFLGGTAVLMPPFAFIQKPLRWLAAIAAHRGTVAGGPNFGYELCLRRVSEAQVAGLDLSSLGVTFCGAEPVRAESLRRFAAHLAPAGFDAASLLPCYGLAEATLLVTGVAKGSGLREVSAGAAGQRQVTCGSPPDGCVVTIRDPDGVGRMRPGDAGEICVAGPHLAAGIWQGDGAAIDPLPGLLQAEGERWLRTGDIGAMTADGLVILDRIKDTVIVHGRKIYAADAEAAAFEAAGPLLSAAAAIGLRGVQGDRLVLLCEVAVAERRGLAPAPLRRRIAEQVGQRGGVLPEVVLLGFGALPRTTSGKIRRQVARQAFLDGNLKLLPSEEPMEADTWAST
ncbi:fatty acyl-AMP ligase [Roseomonas terrae]|jgi:acyl-CoA synthetase (AMP-forming)/AMP-acid ligase II|uniref:Fatty acyl-AMP ligase n=1 Tax=Neoroseomonas terrae TaxID=424799 RepID=A0ABS5EG65_9PROT|nr:fatty acyl-AMP ligase [Neoroseomonas terrae]MBR0650013.1 fatty acyl-AMP ligase [Neoroseomonas terrae]